MVAKTDFIPVLNRQPAIHLSRKLFTAILRRTALRFISDAGIALTTLIAVFSGFPGSQEKLEKMGVSLGPNHM